MSGRGKTGNNQLMLRFLLGVLAIGAAVLGGIGINTLCGYGDLRVSCSATASDVGHNKEAIDELKERLGKVDRMDERIARIAVRLGVADE